MAIAVASLSKGLRFFAVASCLALVSASSASASVYSDRQVHTLALTQAAGIFGSRYPGEKHHE